MVPVRIVLFYHAGAWIASRQHLPQQGFKGRILCGGPAGGAAGPSTGAAELAPFMAAEQQTIDVVRRVFVSVLMQYAGAPGQAQSGQPIVLGHDNIAGLQPVDQRQIGAVRAPQDGQGLCAGARTAPIWRWSTGCSPAMLS